MQSSGSPSTIRESTRCRSNEELSDSPMDGHEEESEEGSEDSTCSSSTSSANQRTRMRRDSTEVQLMQPKRSIEKVMKRAQSALKVDPGRQDAFKQNVLGAVFGLGLELALCVMSSLSFGGSWISKIMWLVFVLLVTLRAVCITFVMRHRAHLDLPQTHKVMKRWRCIDTLKKLIFSMTFIGMFLYPIIMHRGLYEQCEVDRKTFYRIHAWSNHTLKVPTLHIHCEHQWTKVSFCFLEYSEMIITLGIPLLFTFILTKGSEVWNINADKEVSVLQLAVLNLLDLGSLMSLPFRPRGLFWLKHNPVAWVLLILIFLKGWLQTLLQLVVGHLPKKQKDRCQGAVTLMHASSASTNLVLLVARLYFLYIRLPVDVLTVGKNVLCFVYEVATVTGLTWVAVFTSSFFTMIPAADSIRQQAVKQHAGNLNAEDTRDQFMRHAEYLRDLIWCRDKVDDELLWDAFQFFDFNTDGVSSGTFSDMELQEMFNMLGQDVHDRCRNTGEQLVQFIREEKGIKREELICGDIIEAFKELIAKPEFSEKRARDRYEHFLSFDDDSAMPRAWHTRVTPLGGIADKDKCLPRGPH